MSGNRVGRHLFSDSGGKQRFWLQVRLTRMINVNSPTNIVGQQRRPFFLVGYASEGPNKFPAYLCAPTN